MGKYQRKNIGEKHTTKEGYEVVVVDGGDKNNHCWVEFVDGNHRMHVMYYNVKCGGIKNLYHKSIYGVGYRGVGQYSIKTHKKLCKTWFSMLERCYNQKFQAKYPTYIGFTVCDEWHNLQIFGEWYEKNIIVDTKVDKFHLDKDLLAVDNKIYGPDTCIFFTSVY